MSITTKQKRPRRNSTASSSSEQMAVSKEPNEILALGERIVRELKLESGSDTLGRWLAHHLAELMVVARKGEGSEREVAQEKAVDLILKIWSRRHDLPGGANPLKKLEGAVAVLRFLRPDAWPFGGAGTSSTEHLLKKAFDGLQHIVAHGVLVASATSRRPMKLEEAQGFVDRDEAHFAETVNAWINLYNVEPKNRAVRFIFDDSTDLETEKNELDELLNLAPELQARRLFERQIDHLVATLADLKAKIGKSEDDAGAESMQVDDES